jgi:NADH dehydrogenase
VKVGEDLSVAGHPELFVLGDMALVRDASGRPLPGVAPVAMQQGRHVARTILGDLKGAPRKPFAYLDKGQMATIGRSRAIVQSGKLKMNGFIAWLAWLVIHIYYLSSFKNRVFVLIEWAWSYLTFARGARLIVDKHWRSYPDAAPPRLTEGDGASAVPTESQARAVAPQR